jgi:hypothetical protein
MFSLKFNLPCKPWVKHYLENCFGSPIYLRQDGVIGKYFFELVEDASSEYDKECTTEHTVQAVILITESVFLRKGCVLTKTNQRQFNRLVENYFKQQLYLVLDTVVEINDMKIREAIDYAYDRFDMNEAILPLDTMVKAYYRERQERNALKINK